QLDEASGEVFNLGGGPESSVSLLEFMDSLEKIIGKPVEREFADWRPGDQRIYLSDVRKLERELGWQRRMGVEDGVRALLGWVTSNDYFQPASSTRS
ncbi:MAG: CDP-paratose 2-epimerase, partial [Thermoleophilaceae bacterium]|nr:CDP-paratose 2-epimerase [Thermoleophilaceae bacterium]